MSFYTYRQNNVRGSFHLDEKAGISVEVVVEADNAEEANCRAEDIGLELNGGGFCTCCGQRWTEMSDHDDWSISEQAPKEGLEMKTKWDSIKWMDKGVPDTFVHLKDGTFYGTNV